MNVSRICSHCKIEKPVIDFNKSVAKKATGGINYTCRVCDNLYRKEHYIKNKAKYLKRNKDTRTKNRNFIKDYKRNHSCIKCGETHPACLTFHHRDTDTKDFTMSMSPSKGLNKLKEEIAKCDVLCANCHHKLHYAINYIMPS